MIWINLILWAGFYFLSLLLRPKPDIENARPSKLGDLRFPRASAGSPIPIIFGKVNMRAPNTIWYGAFRAIPRTVKVKTGLFSSERQTVGYNYHVSMDLALCLGPNVTLHFIRVEKSNLWASQPAANGDGVVVDLKNAGMEGRIRFYSGNFTQSRNAYLQGLATNGADLPAYVGIAHVVFENLTKVFTVPFIGQITIVTPFFIGEQPQLRAMSFEISRYPDNLGLGANRLIGDDLNLAEILYSLLVEQWGSCGIDPLLINKTSFTTAGTTLKNEGNGGSLIIGSSNDVRSVVEEALRQADGLIYQDPITGQFVLKLIRADYSIPGLTVFDETNIQSVDNFARTSWSETINQVRVIYNSRVRKYNEAAAVVQDGANIATQQGRIKSTELNFPAVTTEALATTLATRELAQGGVPLFRATLRLNRKASLLKPGDPFKFSWPPYGLSEVVMRVQRFDSGELVHGHVVLDCIQDEFAVASAVYADPGGTLDDPTDNLPIDITRYHVFESPYFFVSRLDLPFIVTNDSSYLWALARDPNQKHSGYSFLTSPDNFTEDIVTELNQVSFPVSCELVGNVFKNQAQDDGTLSKVTVRLIQPPGNPFTTQSISDIQVSGKNILLIASTAGLEYWAYESATDLGNQTFELNTVHRALLDTTFVDHLDGDLIYLISGPDWLSQVAGGDTATLNYQLLTFTFLAQQELGDFVTQTIVKNQRYDRPLPPDLIQIEGLRAPIEIIGVTDVDITAFLERNKTSPDEVVFVGDTTDTPEASTTYTARLYLDGILLATSTALTHAGLPFNLTGLSGAGIGRVELEAVKSSLASHTPDWAEFFYANYLNLSAERLTNGNFESTLSTGWTVSSGTWAKVTTSFPLDAVRVVGASTDDENLESSTGTPAELRQDYTIPGADDGKAALFRIWKGGKNSATGQIILEIRDGGGVLKSVTTPLVAANNIGKWELIEIPFSLRTAATIVRVRIMGTGAGSSWDNASLKNHTTSPKPNLTYDTITGLTVTGLWSLRKAHSTYAGALVRIRDTFDDTEQDVGFDTDGNLDAFFVRGEARVVTLYDQSGNAVNLNALNTSRQPRLYWNLTETGRPYIKFDNVNDQLRDPTAGTARPYMGLRPNILFASGPDVDTSSSHLVTIPHQDAAGTTARWGLSADTDWGLWLNTAETNDAGATAPNSGKSLWWLDYQNGLGYHNDDAASTVTWTAADVTYPNSTRLKISAAGDDTLMWGGTFSELCIFTGNIANADRKTVMEEVALYWYNLTV